MEHIQGKLLVRSHNDSTKITLITSGENDPIAPFRHIAAVHDLSDNSGPTNAKRLVLCWNVLEQFDTPLLEEIAEDKSKLLLTERASHDALLEACKLTYERICKNGEWDDGCFYYHNTSAPELEEPLGLLKAALATS